MLDGVAVGIEEGGVPVAEGYGACGAAEDSSVEVGV